ncbi:MAG: hypothetical protein U5L11_04190 [Arhodomonas sp.]|nr:hypothetical protein [Arhodomonas sp.]
MTVSDTDTPELRRAQREGRMVSVRDLLRDARDRRVQLPAEVLMILRDREPLLLPPHTTTLEAGDQLLLCGRADGRARVRRTVNDQESLHYVLTGEHPAHGLHGRWLGPSVGNRVNLSP